MTISSNVSRVDIPGNGSATVFSFSPVIIFAASNLQVYVRDSAGNQTTITQGVGATNWALNFSTFPATGSITYPATGGTPLPVGSTLTIKRVLDLTQLVHLTNQGAYFANVQEAVFDYITCLSQQLQDGLNHTIQLPVTDATAPITLPTSTLRALQLLGFDASGNPIAAQPSSALVSSAMQAFTASASTSAAEAILANIQASKTSAYAPVSADSGGVHYLSGGTFYAVTFAAASTYPANFSLTLVNEETATSGRAKWIVVPGANTAAFYLWPGQFAVIKNRNNKFQVFKTKRWDHPGGTIQVYSNYSSGSDVAGATDGLSAAQPFQTAQNAALIMADQVAFCSQGANTRVQINMAAAMNDAAGLHIPFHDLLGAQGGAAIVFSGATMTINNVVNNGGGLYRVSVADTSSLATNQIVSIYGVAGTGGMDPNHTFKITVISPTSFDCVASTFAGAYTSGGTVTNGSGFSTTTQDAVQTYFGTVIQLQNLLITAGGGFGGVNADWGSKLYILSGCILGTVSTAHFFIHNNAYVEVDNSIGIAGYGTAHVICSMGGVYNVSAAANIDFAASGNFSIAFADAVAGGIAQFNGSINKFGYTVAGVRANAGQGGQVMSATGAPNTYFPGNSNFTVDAFGGFVS